MGPALLCARGDDTTPAQSILLTDGPTETESAPRRGKRTPPAEHASDEGLFTGSIQAVERASVFMRGEPREASGAGAGTGVQDADAEDSPARD